MKQIKRDIIIADESTVWRRLQKLRLNGLIESKGNDFRGDKSTIFGIGKQGQATLLQSDPNEYIGSRCKSNSIEHDIKLVDIRKTFSRFSYVRDYWTENKIQTSLQVAEDGKLSLFKAFNFDAVLRLDNQRGNRLLCGLEFESSQKSQALYDKKLKQLYQEPFLKAVLYICLSEQIENAIKKSESILVSEGDKKLFFVQYSKFSSESHVVTFQNQDNRIIEIR
jgi:hypothetical protein